MTWREDPEKTGLREEANDIFREKYIIFSVFIYCDIMKVSFSN